MLEDLFRPTHLIAVLAVALLLFGPSKLPQLGDALGKTIREFKKAVNGKAEDSNRAETPERVEGARDPAQRQG